MAPLTAPVKEMVATPTAAELEALVIGDDDIDRLGASMCSCNAGDDNPH